MPYKKVCWPWPLASRTLPLLQVLQESPALLAEPLSVDVDVAAICKAYQAGLDSLDPENPYASDVHGFRREAFNLGQQQQERAFQKKMEPAGVKELIQRMDEILRDFSNDKKE